MENSYRNGFLETVTRLPKLKKETVITIRNLPNVTTNVLKNIDEKRCRLYGYVKRMGNVILPKLLKLMSWQSDGRDRNGRLKNGRQYNLRKSCVLREIDAEDREQWKKRLTETFR